MGPEWIAALIAGVATMASTGASIGANSKLNKKNRDWQEKMYDVQVANNRKDAETAYNRQQEMLALGSETQLNYTRDEVGARLQGFKDAGLNPGLAVQGGLTGGQGIGGTSAPQAQAASVGNPQTFAPNILDLSAVAKNLAEAKLLNEKSKTEEDTRNKLKAEVEQINQKIEESKKAVEEMDSRINLNELQTAWQEIQNDVAKATKGEQIELKKYELKNSQAAYNKQIAEIKGLDIDNDRKNEMYDKLFEYQTQQIKKTYYEAVGQDIQNEKERKTMEAFVDAAIETAKKIKAEAKNAEDFEKRFKEQMNLKAKELKIQKTKMWVDAGASVLSSITGAATSILTKGVAGGNGGYKPSTWTNVSGTDNYWN